MLERSAVMRGGSDLQGYIHGFERFLSLLEEAKHDGRTELVVTGLVHFENLLEGVQVDAIAEYGLELLDGLQC